ncbi:UNVERIFIED_CONTAM: hypothetical protein FKN15_064443 [Acipenser sinensis]
MNTRCPPKRVPSAGRFFTHCRLTVQPPQSYSVGGQRRSWAAYRQACRCQARLQGSLVRVALRNQTRFWELIETTGVLQTNVHESHQDVMAEQQEARTETKCRPVCNVVL